MTTFEHGSTVGQVSGSWRSGLEGLARVALGRGLACGLLLATVTKGGERVTLQVAGDGPLGSVVVDANDLGQVRGYLSRRPPIMAANTGADAIRLPVAPLVGTEGRVVVHRDLGLREIYQGSIALESGEMDEDLERYLNDSEQMPTAPPPGPSPASCPGSARP